MILHTHTLLHLFLISNFSDLLSLINTTFRIEQDSLAKSKRRQKRRLFGKIEEDALETSFGLQGP